MVTKGYIFRYIPKYTALRDPIPLLLGGGYFVLFCLVLSFRGLLRRIYFPAASLISITAAKPSIFESSGIYEKCTVFRDAPFFDLGKVLARFSQVLNFRRLLRRINFPIRELLVATPERPSKLQHPRKFFYAFGPKYGCSVSYQTLKNISICCDFFLYFLLILPTGTTE